MDVELKEDEEKALASIIDATTRDSTNYQYWSLRGNIFQRLNKVKESKYAFLVAYNLDSTKFNANYGLGIIYNNLASSDFDQYNNYPYKLSAKEKTERENVKISGDDNIRIAISYFEIALKANPIDEELYDTIRILKDLYAKSLQDEKYMEMKALLDSLD